MSTDTTVGPAGFSSDPSTRARELVEAGKIGGPRPGSGRPRKIRPSELAAEAARQHWDAIEQALLGGVSEGSAVERARAATQWLRLAVGEGALELRERAEDRLDDYVLLSDAEVRQQFAQRIASMLRGGELDSAALGELPMVDADVVEVDTEAPA